MHLGPARVDLMSGVLAAPRLAGTYHVLAVCAGNICRSPILDVVISARFEGLDEIEVRSAGTGRWHVGQPMDPRAAYALAVHGFDGTAHRAQTLSPGLLRWADTVLAASEVADGLYEAYVSPR